MSELKNLIDVLKEIVGSPEEKFSLDACICIGKFGIKDCQLAIDRLLHLIKNNTNWNYKTLALETLVRHYEVKESFTFKYILTQIEHSPIWVSRIAALKLLCHLGFF